MLPTRRSQSHSRQAQLQHTAGSRPLHALRSTLSNRRANSGVHCASAKKPEELSPQEKELLQRVMNYQHTVDLPEGQLVVSPLRERWLQQTGDLLADTFVDAKGIQPYRRYVRRNIGKYLDQHINMPPAAVLVTAVLRTQVQGSPSTDLGLHEVQPSTPSSSTDAAGGGGGSSSSGSARAADAAPQAAADHPLTQLLLGCFSWLAKPNAPDAAAAVSGSPSSSTNGAAASKQLTTASHGTAASSSGSGGSDGSDTSSPADAYAVVDAVSSTSRSAPAAADTSSSGAASSGPNVAALVGSALQRLSDSVPQLRLQQKAGQTHVVETLVGVAEVSFQERTRSQALTLNPPQKCGYLCNMAVAKQWRRRGIAGTLMTAIEDLCLLAGESDLYLHLRFKDAATAGSLYSKHGFAQASKDCWLLLLVGQEPRFLMLKQLAADRTLAGQVLLPGFKQGVTAAGLQQQDQQPQEGGGSPQQPSAAPAASPAA